MKNFGLILLAGGAAIAGLGFFMRKGEDDDTDEHIEEIDRSKAQPSRPILKRPGNLNVITEVRIATVSAIYS